MPELSNFYEKHNFFVISARPFSGILNLKVKFLSISFNRFFPLVLVAYSTGYEIKFLIYYQGTKNLNFCHTTNVEPNNDIFAI